jgi:hypothetical protein
MSHKNFTPGCSGGSLPSSMSLLRDLYNSGKVSFDFLLSRRHPCNTHICNIHSPISSLHLRWCRVAPYQPPEVHLHLGHIVLSCAFSNLHLLQTLLIQWMATTSLERVPTTMEWQPNIRTKRTNNHFDCVALNVNIIVDPRPENGHLKASK